MKKKEYFSPTLQVLDYAPAQVLNVSYSSEADTESVNNVTFDWE